jgi:deoxyribodipyrimidine photolyase-related protein
VTNSTTRRPYSTTSIRTPDAFSDWADGEKDLVMEHFFRAQRRRTALLMQENGGPGGDA